MEALRATKQGNLFNLLFSDWDQGQPYSNRSDFALRADVAENDDAYLIFFDIPGLAEDELTIEVKDQRLSVSGERKLENDDETLKFRRRERQYGKFEKNFTIPLGTDLDEIKAKFEQGVLSITIPKVPETKPKRIELNA